MVAWKCAQCGQVIEAYSTIVTLASGLPIDLFGQHAGLEQLGHVDRAGRLSAPRRGLGRIGGCGRRCRIGRLHVLRLGLVAGIAAGGKQRRHRRDGEQRGKDLSARKGTNHANHPETCWIVQFLAPERQKSRELARIKACAGANQSPKTRIAITKARESGAISISSSRESCGPAVPANRAGPRPRRRRRRRRCGLPRRPKAGAAAAFAWPPRGAPASARS